MNYNVEINVLFLFFFYKNSKLGLIPLIFSFFFLSASLYFFTCFTPSLYRLWRRRRRYYYQKQPSVIRMWMAKPVWSLDQFVFLNNIEQAPGSIPGWNVYKIFVSRNYLPYWSKIYKATPLTDFISTSMFLRIWKPNFIQVSLS